MTRSEALLILVGTDPTITSALTFAVLEQEGLHPGCTHPWSISTKYYDANISVRLLDVSDPTPSQPDACILVVDAAVGESLSRVQRWWETRAIDGSSVRVLAAYGADEEDPRLEAARAWCADQLVELVAVPLPGDGEALSLTSEGVTRIHEALQAHVWPGLRLKPSPQHGRAAMYATGENDVAEPLGPSLLGGSCPNPFLDELRGDAPGNWDEDEPDSSVQLGKALEAAAGLRGRLAEMAPEQRRAAAEETLFGLLELLGLSDDDDEASEEEDSRQPVSGHDDSQAQPQSKDARQGSNAGS
ncbi:hypothetical protein ACKKBF_B10840 [Auxenochlorella protothecoides x Auxenochlorella symbiontica]